MGLVPVRASSRAWAASAAGRIRLDWGVLEPMGRWQLMLTIIVSDSAQKRARLQKELRVSNQVR